jgi:hypothetical protein
MWERFGREPSRGGLETPQKFSRRNFFRRVAQVARNPRLESRYLGEREKQLMDEVVEGIGEWGMIATMIHLAWRSSRDPIFYYEVRSESNIGELKEFSEMLSQVSFLGEILGEVVTPAHELENAWYNAYRKTRVVCISRPATTCGRNGCRTVTEPNCYPERYWDEPDFLASLGIDNQRLSRWTNFFAKLHRQTSIILQTASNSFDLRGGENALVYDKELVDPGERLVLAVLLYGAVAGGFAFWEEILEKVSQGEVKVEERWIKRRTFLKLLVGLGLSWKIREIQKAFVKENQDLLGEIQDHARRVVAQMNVPPEQSFKRFFGRTPEEIRANLADIIEKCEIASHYKEPSGLFGPSDWEKAKLGEYFARLTEIAGQARERFDKYFSYDEESGQYTVPTELTEILNAMWATKETLSFVRRKEIALKTQHLWDAGFAGAVMALSAALGEYIIFPASDSLLNRRF